MGTSFRSAMGELTGPTDVEATALIRLPDRLHYRGEPNNWVRTTHPGHRLHSVIEGPCFGDEGHLWLVDVPYGRIFRSDVTCAPNGDLWFTDPGRSSLTDPTGWLFGMRHGQTRPELVLANVPCPNDVAIGRTAGRPIFR